MIPNVYLNMTSGYSDSLVSFLSISYELINQIITSARIEI